MERKLAGEGVMRIKKLVKIAQYMLIMFLVSGHANSSNDQIFYLGANENTVIAVISKTEISRISFLKEIESVHLVKGEIEYEVTGRDLYLRAFVDKPINFFVKTFAGKTYKFIVTPQDLSATQIFIRSAVIKTTKSTKSHSSCQNKDLPK